MNIISIMKALGDETRLRILNLLNKDELCVCEVEHLLNINQSNASRHLNKLSNSGLVKYRKNALYVYYMINNDALVQFPFLRMLLGVETAKIPQCREDVSMLCNYKANGLTCEDLKNGKVCFKDIKEE
ncbi:MAG: metalloregulator ArsR/SmtB family transcription factor [Lutisporaceae bacterium]